MAFTNVLCMTVLFAIYFAKTLEPGYNHIYDLNDPIVNSSESWITLQPSFSLLVMPGTLSKTTPFTTRHQPQTFTLLLSLALCGDVASNPGPKHFPCGYCDLRDINVIRP